MRMPRLNQYTPSLMTTRNTFMGAGPGYYGSAPLTGASPSTFMGAGPGYYGQSIPNSGRPIIPYTPSPDASIDYTNEPKTSWWDDFSSGLDRDFLMAAAQSLGGGGSGYSGRGGGGGVSRAGGRYGANIRPSEPVGAGMPVPGTAPNPSFAQGLVLPRRRQDQYSGGY